MLKIGTEQVTNIYIGNQEINKAYLGNELVYSKAEPLTFEVGSAGEISIGQSNNEKLEYKKNNENWKIFYYSTPISVNTGDIIKFRGNGGLFGGYNAGFKSTATINKVKGNIISLIYKNNYYKINYIDEDLNYLFYNMPIIDVSELILPDIILVDKVYESLFRNTTIINTPILKSTTLTRGCYYQMFSGCRSLTTAPTLPATNLVKDCYREMFYNCSSLNYIKCLATDISASNCTTNWVRNVPSTGTFVKNTNTTWTTGENGIPTGWTIQNV